VLDALRNLAQLGHGLVLELFKCIFHFKGSP
jgi:hypothetical protein